MIDRDRNWVREPGFDELVNSGFSSPPPDAIVSAVNPWRRAMNRALWGLALTTVTLNFWLLDDIFPAIGAILSLLGFRTLRRENGWFKACYVLTVLQAAIRFPCLVLNATVYQQRVYSLPVFDGLIAVNLTAGFVLLFCLWRGFKAVQRKAGTGEHAGGAAALMVWYVVLLLLALVNYSGLLGLLLIAAYIFIIRALFKLSRELDEAGYAIQAAPVRLPDRLLTAVIAAALLLGVACGYLFGDSYPMAWSAADPAGHAMVEDIKAHLAGLGFPEEVLDDLTAGDIQACEGALQVAVDVTEESADGDHDSKELRITGVAVRLPGEREQWKLFHHFLWTEDPGFYGTEAIQLWPASQLDGWATDGELTGQVLYTRNGRSYTSPYASLGTETYTSNSLFWGEQTNTDPFAAFSFPREGEDQRGYVSYTVREMIDGYIISSWCNYIHQRSWMQYPVRTAVEYRMSGAWTQSGPFFIVQDALQFYAPEDGELEMIS